MISSGVALKLDAVMERPDVRLEMTVEVSSNSSAVSIRLCLIGPELQFADNDARDKLDHLAFALGALVATVRQILDFRHERAEACPKLVPRRDDLKFLGIHWWWPLCLF